MLPLPGPFRETLPRSPLALVACQLKYAEPAHALSGAKVAKIVKALEEAAYPYPRVEQVQLNTVTLSIEPGVAMQNQAQKGWRMVSTDGRWIAMLTPDSVSVETTRYGRWSTDFKPRMEALFRAFYDAVKPTVELRLGLRYVDLITAPLVRNATEWRQWLGPVLLGPLDDPVVGTKVVATQEQMTLALTDTTRATVRHGCQTDAARDNAYTYVIDTDHYRDSLQEFDLRSVVMACDELHDLSVSLFRYFITDRMFEYLKQQVEK